MRKEFADAIIANQAAFDLELSDETIEKLADYLELVQEHNPVLHLVAPCSPEEFATRHVLESLTLLEHLPIGAKFADVGTGAGLPAIPCLIVRRDLSAVLIESKEKKSAYLRAAVESLALTDRAVVLNRQFEEADAADASFITCRALDKFTEKLGRLIKWSGKRRMLLFGGDNLRTALSALQVSFHEQLMPLSERRFLFVEDGKTLPANKKRP